MQMHPIGKGMGNPSAHPQGIATFTGKFALLDKYHWWQYQSHDPLRVVVEMKLSDVFSGASCSDSPQQDVLNQCLIQNDQDTKTLL